MDPAYYVAAGSLKARSLAMDVVANNLANASTHGFKPDRTFFTLFNKAKGDIRRALLVERLLNSGIFVSLISDFPHF